jgi:hypothetical protein
MPRPVPAVEAAMEAQEAVRSLRSACSPLWAATLASGDWSLISECQALSATLAAAQQQLRRIAGLAESIESQRTA